MDETEKGRGVQGARASACLRQRHALTQGRHMRRQSVLQRGGGEDTDAYVRRAEDGPDQASCQICDLYWMLETLPCRWYCAPLDEPMRDRRTVNLQE